MKVFPCDRVTMIDNSTNNDIPWRWCYTDGRVGTFHTVRQAAVAGHSGCIQVFVGLTADQFHAFISIRMNIEKFRFTALALVDESSCTGFAWS